jgi:hypothetical protein
MRANQKNKRKDAIKSKSLRSKLYIAVGLIGIIGPFVYSVVGAETIEYGDDLCPKSRPVEGHTVLLVDASEPIRNGLKHALESTISDIRKDLSRFERFSIYAITPDHNRLPQKIVSMCNPGTRKDADKWTESPKTVETKFNQEFGPGLDKAFERLSTGKEAQYSPILESIKAVEQFDNFNDTNHKRKLVVFSDMLQNMPAYSHYRMKSPDWDKERTADPIYAETVTANLKGVEVEIHYLLQKQYQSRQTAIHQRFWRDYFSDTGATPTFKLTEQSQQG